MVEGAATAAARIDAWLETVRAPLGFTGPVAHWWRDCLADCRPGYDWRYEGIIAGYLELEARTGDGRWLARARRAGEDLLVVLRPDGHLPRSGFEMNPAAGGTPHEAAAATGLLRLALRLRGRDPDAAQRYAEAAGRILDRQVARLWDADARAFRDDPAQPSFVPNKACTLIEALALRAETSGQERHLAEHAVPTAEAVLRHQLRRPGSRLDGAIAQNSFGVHVVEKYFPYYVARCVPGLLAVHARTRDDRYADAALAAGRFVLRWRDADGGFPQVVYADGRVNPYPRWFAAVGDVLLALDMLRPLGLDPDLAATEAWLTSGLLPTGGVMTAQGFAAQVLPTLRPGPPELRDLLSVAGWVDKAFRYFASVAEAVPADRPTTIAPTRHEAECQFRGRRLLYRADAEAVSLHEGGRVAYRWRLGGGWADVAEPWLLVR